MRDLTTETKEERLAREDGEKEVYYRNTMRKFQGFCVVCFPNYTYLGVTVHEVYPRSQHPTDWWKMEGNGCPLCQKHHDYVHTLPSAEAVKFCEIHMEKCLRGLGEK